MSEEFHPDLVSIKSFHQVIFESVAMSGNLVETGFHVYDTGKCLILGHCCLGSHRMWIHCFSSHEILCIYGEFTRCIVSPMQQFYDYFDSLDVSIRYTENILEFGGLLDVSSLRRDPILSFGRCSDRISVNCYNDFLDNSVIDPFFCSRDSNIYESCGVPSPVFATIQSVSPGLRMSSILSISRNFLQPATKVH